MTSVRTDKFYGFESIEATSLALIPLSIRYRLDCCAIKLHLQQWLRFALAERAQLVHLPFADAADVAQWATQLTTLVQQHCGCTPDRLTDAATPVWQQHDRWPAVIIERCAELELALPEVAVWRDLPAPDRHALFKIARSRHDYVQLTAALHELTGDRN